MDDMNVAALSSTRTKNTDTNSKKAENSNAVSNDSIWKNEISNQIEPELPIAPESGEDSIDFSEKPASKQASDALKGAIDGFKDLFGKLFNTDSAKSKDSEQWPPSFDDKDGFKPELQPHTNPNSPVDARENEPMIPMMPQE